VTVNLTAAHIAVLEAIEPKGATRDKLGEHATSRELGELIEAGLVWVQPIELRETALRVSRSRSGT
jgi:hypothetical protein